MAESESGMTLMELLIVIAILGLLTAMVMPLGGRMDSDARAEQTMALFRNLRFALLGPENAYDLHGNKVIGGYIGDFGQLPELFVYEWDHGAKTWRHPADAEGEKPRTTLNDSPTPGDDNAMPTALWRNQLLVEGEWRDLTDKTKWKGPYLYLERDAFPHDDDLYTYTEGAADGSSKKAENRLFMLRQGKDRLIDGWGSALIVYRRDGDLVFVSAGPDRLVSFEDPADPSLPRNSDNLIMTIAQGEWDLTSQKTVATMAQLMDIKAAIIGKQGLLTDGVRQPNGFAADIGSLEPLTGSYVRRGGATVYRCVLRHVSGSGNGPPSSTYWEEADDEVDYPHALEWVEGRQYHEAQPHLLAMNADYVLHAGLHYRCIAESVASGSPAASPEDWVRDDTFKGQEWVREWTNAKSYTSSILPEWKFYPGLRMGAGWRGPYVFDLASALWDGWGGEIMLVLDHERKSLEIVSPGPDGIAGTTDDMGEAILRTDFELPAIVTVKGHEDATIPAQTANVIVTTDDYVDIYTPYNGSVRHRRASTTSDGHALFSHFEAERNYAGMPDIVDDEHDPLGERPAPELDESFNDGPWLPIGTHYVVFRSQQFRNDELVPGDYASPHPKTFGASGLPGPSGYQKQIVLHPRTFPTIRLGE